MKKAIAAIITLAMAASAACALAVEWRLGEETQLKVSGAVTFGTGIRTEDPRPENYGSLAGTRVGRSDGLTAANSGGPNLNFEQGRPFTTVLKGFADFDLGRRSFGAFARLKGWYDYELEKGDRPMAIIPMPSRRTSRSRTGGSRRRRSSATPFSRRPTFTAGSILARRVV